MTRLLAAIALLLATIVVAVLLAVSTVMAQDACFPAASFIAGLAENYHEVPLWEGLMSQQGGPPVPIVMFAAPHERTWTLVRTDIPKVVCPMINGTDIDSPQFVKLKVGAPS